MQKSPINMLLTYYLGKRTFHNFFQNINKLCFEKTYLKRNIKIRLMTHNENHKPVCSGVTIGIIIALLWAIRPVLQKYILDSFSFPTVMFIGAVLYIIFVIFFISLYGHQQVQDELLKMTKAQAGIFLVISIVGFLASILYYKALSENSASEIVTITSMWPLFAIVFASLFLGESQDPYLLIVLFLILCYVSAFQFAKNNSI